MSKNQHNDDKFYPYFFLAIALLMAGLITYAVVEDNERAEAWRAERDQLLAQEEEILPDETRVRFVDPNSRSGERYFGIIVHDQTGCMYAVDSEGGTGRMSFPLLNTDGTCMREDTQ